MRAFVAVSALALAAAALVQVSALPMGRLRGARADPSFVAMEAAANVGINCWTAAFNFADLKNEFRDAQRNDPTFGGHVRGKGLTQTHGSAADQTRLTDWFNALDAYAAAVHATVTHAGAGEVNDGEQLQLALELLKPWRIGERMVPQVTKNVRKFPLFQKQQVVVTPYQPAPSVDPFDHIADVLQSHHLHSGSVNAQHRHTLLVQTLQALRTCLQQRVRQALDGVRDAPHTHLLNGGVSFKAAGDSAQVTVLRGGDAKACGAVPVKQYTGGLSDPEFTSVAVGVHKELRLSASLSGGNLDATHTWALVPYSDNVCWYTLVPNTAKAWVTPTLSGCFVFVADDGSGNLLVMHTNANRIGVDPPRKRDANIRAKLDCIQHALAAHPTYHPAAQLLPGSYMAWGVGGTPFGVNTNPGHAGGWNFYYSVPTHRATAAAHTTSAVVNAWPACGGGGHACVFSGDAVGSTYGPSSVHERRDTNSPAICKVDNTGAGRRDDGTW